MSQETLCRDALHNYPRESVASVSSHETVSDTSSRLSGVKSLQGGAGGSKRIALAFYGLTRSLKYTIDSIQLNVMDQLKQAGYEYDVYLHTYDLKSLSNIRSGEAGELNTTEWKLLAPDYVQIDDQVCLLRALYSLAWLNLEHHLPALHTTALVDIHSYHE